MGVVRLDDVVGDLGNGVSDGHSLDDVALGEGYRQLPPVLHPLPSPLRHHPLPRCRHLSASPSSVHLPPATPAMSSLPHTLSPPPHPNPAQRGLRRGPDVALRGLADRFGGLDVTSEGRGVVVAVVARRGTAAASLLRNGDGNCSTSLGRNLAFTTPCAAAGISSATHTPGGPGHFQIGWRQLRPPTAPRPHAPTSLLLRFLPAPSRPRYPRTTNKTSPSTLSPFTRRTTCISLPLPFSAPATTPFPSPSRNLWSRLSPPCALRNAGPAPLPEDTCSVECSLTLLRSTVDTRDGFTALATHAGAAGLSTPLYPPARVYLLVCLPASALLPATLPSPICQLTQTPASQQQLHCALRLSAPCRHQHSRHFSRPYEDSRISLTLLRSS
ncbi:hypothetical protein E2C01_001597 [Portunus trituberculatus]|uniref:Uncharacterized protein n=1 Tax=Portunus trituberculatus TaxID=210409 RepID=A0A5B7CKU3_PORTR|nr:hypothetical protein [Portunus trituberculatus]